MNKVENFLKSIKIEVSYTLIFVVFSLFMLFTFRGTVDEIPQLIGGERFIAFDELIPIFDLKTQFSDQIINGFSPLTNTNEIRVRYSALTTWTRYSPIILFSLIFVNAISYLIFVHSSKRILDLALKKKQFTDSEKKLIAAVAMFPLFIILLYAKITHYYTLIFGLALFYWSLVETLSLFLEKNINKKRLVLLTLVVLLNPAVHYHVLYYLFGGIFWLSLAIRYFVLKLSRNDFQRKTLALAAVFIISLAGYGLFLFSLDNVYTDDNLNSVAPVNLSVIRNASPSLQHILSLDMYSPIDNFYYQQYLPPVANLHNSVLLFISFAPFVLFPIYRQVVGRNLKVTEPYKYIYLLNLFVSLLCIYMALGLNSEVTVYSLISNNANSGVFNNAFGSLFMKFAETFVQVIRFPHRFQLVYLCSLAINLTLSIAMLYLLLKKVNNQVTLSKYTVIGVKVFLSCFVMFLPLINPAVAQTFVSGNWNGLFEPFKIEGAKEIRNLVKDNEKVFYAPYLEFNNYITEEGDKHKFIDKFWLYLVNKPGSYYGLGGDLINKLNAFLFYRATLYEDKWWVKLLQDAGFKYFVLIKNTQSNLFDTDRSIDRIVKDNTEIKKIYESENFVLYELEKINPENELVTVLNWPTFIKLMNENSVVNKRKFNYQFNVIGQKLDNKSIMTDDPEGAKYYYEVIENPGNISTISASKLTFLNDVYPASSFLASTLSPFSILNEEENFNKIGMAFPSVILKGNAQFTAIKGKFKTNISLNIKKECTLLINSVASKNQIKLTLKKDNKFVADDILNIEGSKDRDSKFTKTDIKITPGKYDLEFDKQDDGAFVLNYVLCSDDEYQKNLKLENKTTITLSNGEVIRIYQKTQN